MKYVVLVPDGCADVALAELDGRTPLEAARMPRLAALARRGEVGRAAVIPPGLPPGSDVGNMAILGYDPARYHTGRAPIEAAAMGVELGPDERRGKCPPRHRAEHSSESHAPLVSHQARPETKPRPSGGPAKAPDVRSV